MNDQHKDEQPTPSLASLYPQLSAEELQAAATRIDRYLTLATAILESALKDPERAELLKQLLTHKRAAAKNEGTKVDKPM